MQETKVINILRTFTKKELKDFEKFAASPYHNSGKNCGPFLKQLKKFHPKYESRNLTFENIHAKLYPGKKFNKQVMWNLTSTLEKMAEGFLEQLSLNKFTFEKQRYLAREYQARGLYSNYKRLLDKMDMHLDEIREDHDYFFYRSELELYKKEYHLANDQQFLLYENILRYGEYLILSFLKNSSLIVNDIYVNSIRQNAGYNLNLPFELIRNIDFKNFISYAKKNNYNYSQKLEAYFYSMMTKIEPDNTEHFFKLKNIFEQNLEQFSISEKLYNISSLINYCSAKKMAGDDEFAKILFELNKYLLKEKIAFFPYNYLPKILYLQILLNALDVKEIQWAQEFIRIYTVRLKPEIKETMLALALAYLNFNTGNYTGVLENLHKVEFTEQADKLTVKTLTAASYYEMNEINLLLTQIDSSMHFFKNNKSIGEKYVKPGQTFFKYLKKLVIAKENPDKESTEMLKNQISTTSEITNKKWLLEKIKELEKA